MARTLLRWFGGAAMVWWCCAPRGPSNPSCRLAEDALRLCVGGRDPLPVRSRRATLCRRTLTFAGFESRRQGEPRQPLPRAPRLATGRNSLDPSCPRMVRSRTGRLMAGGPTHRSFHANSPPGTDDPTQFSTPRPPDGGGVAVRGRKRLTAARESAVVTGTVDQEGPFVPHRNGSRRPEGGSGRHMRRRTRL